MQEALRTALLSRLVWRSGRLCGILLMSAAVTKAAVAAQLPALRLGPKPADGAVERRARTQPTVPENAREIPFDETAPEPALTQSEQERGYLLFQRPLTESIYPNTRPLPHERIEALVAFATLGQFEPVGTAPAAKGSYTVLATLEAENGAVWAEARQDLAAPHHIAMSIAAAKPGDCTLRLTLLDAAGTKCSESAQPVIMLAGPLY